MENLDRIEEIWTGNPKIPFMQTKEILKYGYEKGIEDGKKINTNKTVQSKDIKDINQNEGKTSKEMIEYAKSVKNETKHKFEKEKIKEKIDFEKEKIKEKIDLTANILEYIKNNDLVQVYMYVKELNADYQEKLARANNKVYIKII